MYIYIYIYIYIYYNSQCILFNCKTRCNLKFDSIKKKRGKKTMCNIHNNSYHTFSDIRWAYSGLLCPNFPWTDRPCWALNHLHWAYHHRTRNCAHWCILTRFSCAHIYASMGHFFAVSLSKIYMTFKNRYY